MAVLNGILRIIARALLGIAAAVGVGCLAWTLLATQARAVIAAGDGLPTILRVLREASGEAASGVAGRVISGVTGGASDASSVPEVVSGAAQAVGSALATATASAQGAAGSTTADAYRQWEDGISSPAARVFAGTPVTEEMLEGLAGGSITATDAVASLDASSLATITTNARNLSSVAATHAVPEGLPTDAREQMSVADARCQDFCAQILAMVPQVEDVASGDVTSVAALSRTAASAQEALRAMDDAMDAARTSVGVAG